MIRLNNIHLPLAYNDDLVLSKASKALGVEKKAIKSCTIFRRSVDARKKDNIFFMTTLDVTLAGNEEKVCRRCKNAVIAKPYEYTIEKYTSTTRPLVVGAGPAGLFAALILAQSGAKPILVERGKDVDSRTNDVNKFWTEGILDETSNVQFGEGGAGTFSDGKLNTGTKDSRQRKVLEEFVTHGAPDEILYNAKPHIGTDKLKTTVKNIRNEIISLGGQVLFETKLTEFETKDNQIIAAEVEHFGKKEKLETDSIILAIGHSARDTFEMIHSKGLPIEAKAFSVGARIEHLRENIDKSQYGKFAKNKNLGAASYKMNVHLENGRGVYTFCMCPGGKVVNASSEKNRLVTNGMSEFARNEVNSNAALLVGVYPEDFRSENPLAGMYFQRELEEKAFIAGGENYNAPVQRVADFLENKASTKLGEVIPSIGPDYTLTNLDKCLPDFVTASMRQAITQMDKKLCGFANGDAILTGAETRSSSPIRILRNDNLESVAVRGLYPCGEGAGYAGGIISAAVDGIKCAEKIIEKSNNGGI
ncbi:MAG: FAD-dependent oxidoreductase [Ruminococcus sp.]|nr:FAD-dependent oxidoreductase [Ruminococcus sp.]